MPCACDGLCVEVRALKEADGLYREAAPDTKLKLPANDNDRMPETPCIGFFSTDMQKGKAMIVRKPVYLIAGLLVLVFALAISGVFQGRGLGPQAPSMPSAGQTVLHASGMSALSPVIVNQYGWYTDGASNTHPDRDSREH